MADVRNDVANLMKPTTTTTTINTASKEMYRVRKTWADAASQKGAFTDKNNAIDCCKKAGSGYEVYDSKGKVVYPTTTTTATTANKTTTTTSTFKSYKVKVTAADGLNVRKSASTSSAIVGVLTKGTTVEISKESNGWGYVVAKKGWIYLQYTSKVNTTTNSTFKSYKAKVTADVLNVRKGAGTNYAVVSQLMKNTTVTISKTSGNWGYIANKGWIHLDYIKKV